MAMKKMRCVGRSTGLVPNSIKLGDEYYLDERSVMRVDSGMVGLFYFDSLKANYAGIENIDRMEEVVLNG